MEFTYSQLRILEMIKNKSSISRKRIAEELGLTPAAITKAIEPLLKNNVVLEVAQRKSTGGRKPIDLSLNKNSIGDIIGVSITPTSLVTTIGNIDGDIFKSKSYKILESEDVLEILENTLDQELKKYKNIRVISLVITGLINPEQGVIIFSPHYKQKKIEIKKRIEEKFNLPVLIEWLGKSCSYTVRNKGSAQVHFSFIKVQTM